MSILTDALVDLIEREPENAEPLVVKMLEDPQADQLLAELKVKSPASVDALAKLYDTSKPVRDAFDKLMAKRPHHN